MWACLETVIEGVSLVAVGYKYNRKKVICFCMTKGAGATTPGTAYIAKFTDGEGLIASREVGRFVAASRYFGYSDRIDMHNNRRQYELGLEKKWVTQDPWFRHHSERAGVPNT